MRHRTTEFRKFLGTIERTVPPGLDVHLILDNYSTPKRRRSSGGAKRPHFHVHFTPIGAQWVNLVER